MGHALVIAGGEVQVDIRDFITVKAEEYGKRNIVAVFIEGRAALRAFLVGKVESAAYGAVGKELCPVALGAYIVRRQGVDFRNA